MGADPGDGADQVAESLKGLDHHLDPGGQGLDRGGVLVDQVQVHPGHEGMMLAEPPGQRLGQFRDLRAESTLGQVSQRGGVVIPDDECLEHQPAGDTEDVRGNRGQLDPGVLEQLLQSLGLPTAFTGDRGPGPGQVPQLPDRLGWHERAPDQPVRTELGQPGRIGDIGLAAREVLHVPGVDQQDLEPGVLEQVVERLPVVPGGLHHRTRDSLLDQMVTQGKDLVGHRSPGGDRLDGLAEDVKQSETHLVRQSV